MVINQTYRFGDNSKASSLRLFFISEHYYPLLGGTVNYVSNVTREMKKRGHEIYLITYSCSDETKKNTWLDKDGIKIYYIKVPSFLGYNTRLARLFFTLRLKVKISHFVEDIKPHAVHVLYGHSVVKVLKKLPVAIPKVWTIQNVPPNEYSAIKLSFFKILNKAVERAQFFLVRKIHERRIATSRADRIICVSHNTTALVEKILSRNKIKAKPVMIPNGFSPEIFRPIVPPENNEFFISEQYPKILSVAGVIEHKGQLEALNVLSELRKKYSRPFFLNLGPVRSFYYAATLQSYIKQKDLGSLCAFSSVTDKQRLNEAYASCDVYFQPSYQEGFCMAALEAAACGKIIVGTAVGAIGEIIETAGYGYICKPGDTACFLSGILRALELKLNPVEKQKMRDAVVSKYSWSQIGLATEKEYRKPADLFTI